MCDKPRTCLGARFFSVSGFPSAFPRLTGDFRARHTRGSHLGVVDMGLGPCLPPCPAAGTKGEDPPSGRVLSLGGDSTLGRDLPPWGRSPPRGGVDWLTSTNQLKYNGESCGFYAILWNLRSNPQGHIKLNYET